MINFFKAAFLFVKQLFLCLGGKFCGPLQKFSILHITLHCKYGKYNPMQSVMCQAKNIHSRDNYYVFFHSTASNHIIQKLCFHTISQVYRL